MINYNLLLEVWVYSSLPFTLGCLMEITMIYCFNKMIKVNKTQEDIQNILEGLIDVKDKANEIPVWMSSFLLVLVALCLSITDGFLWFVEPYKQIRRLWNILFWNFEKV